MVPRFLLSLVSLLVLASVASADLQPLRRLTQEEVMSLGGVYNDKEGRFAWWNETVEDPLAEEHAERRATLGLGDSSPVTVTFYEQPGMYCSEGEGQCGFGTDVTGRAMGAGGPFLKTSLYPNHCASGNMPHLGGCGACGVLCEGKHCIGFVVTDVTDPLDELGPRSWPPFGSHIDLCLSTFQIYRPGTKNENGGIFTGTWIRVNCNSMGAPNMPTNNIVVRLQAWNQWAKACVISRMGGTGEIVNVLFYTAQDRNGGWSGNGNRVVHQGYRVQGWGAWWSPNKDLTGLGGVGLQVTLSDGKVLTTNGYPMPDYKTWQTGEIMNVFENVN